MLTSGRSSANPQPMSKAFATWGIGAAFLLGGCVRIEAPDKPIEINLNVNIRQEVIVSLKKDAEQLMTQNPELFPQ